VLFFKGFKKFKGILGNREFRVDNTATKIISAVGKQCQPDGTQSKTKQIPSFSVLHPHQSSPL
jgi:hypothetical protein